MNNLIKPNILAVLFSPNCHSYSIDMGNDTAIFLCNHSKSNIYYEEITGITLTNGLIWKTLTVRTIGEIKFKGLSTKKAIRIKNWFEDRRAELLSIKSKFETAIPKLNEVVDWLDSTKKGEFWISNKQLLKIKSDASIFSEFLNLPTSFSRLFRQYEKKMDQIKRFLDESGMFQEKANNVFTQKEVQRFESFFKSVEKYPLTAEQCEAIISDEDATLVVAAAGSGKTSLLIGKVGYLLQKQLAKPQEITILAFNSSIQKEIESKIELKFKAKCNTHTFHAFGLDIIAKSNHKKPSLATFVENDEIYKETINDLVDNVFRQHQYTKEIGNFFISHHKPYKSHFEFKTKGEYHSYIKNNHLLTLNGEYVKSFEELEIANFLYVSGIRYEYEKKYEIDVADSKHRQYQPDFYISDHRICIEHFAIDKNGDTPDFIEKETYKQSMEWKRETHQKNGTQLIETYSYKKKEGVLLKNLTNQLKHLGVQFKPISSEDLFKKLNDTGYISQFSVLCATFLNLYKSRNLSFKELKANLNNSLQAQRFLAFLDIFEYVYHDYQQLLSNKGDIDFHDMINLAVGCIKKTSFSCKYLLVDEFQDISPGRAQLIKAVQNINPDTKIFCVGDDWQSIYRFTGSDIHLMTNFESHFGYTKIFRLTKTFRFNDRIASVASTFIQRNKSQLSKEVVTVSKSNKPEVALILSKPEKIQSDLILIYKEIAKNSDHRPTDVLVLGRYKRLKEVFSESKVSQEKIAPYCKFTFQTIHSSKGKEADYVVLLGMDGGMFGFPSTIVDDPIINSMLSEEEKYPDAEERRLLYVGLTRAKKRVFLISCKSNNVSSFFIELARDNYDIDSKNIGTQLQRFCPKCKTSMMVEKIGKKDDTKIFFGCENYPICKYTIRPCRTCGIGFLNKKGNEYICDNPSCKASAEVCPRCHEGVLELKKGPYSKFWGCSNYSSTPRCFYNRKF